MPDQLLEAVITLEECEIGNDSITLRDTNNVRYSFWKNKKDGTETKAWEAFKPYALEPRGKNFSIKYKETPNEKNPQYPYRNIMILNITNNAPQAPISTPQAVSGQSTTPAQTTRLTGNSGANNDTLQSILHTLGEMKMQLAFLVGKKEAADAETTHDEMDAEYKGITTDELDKIAKDLDSNVKVEDIPF